LREVEIRTLESGFGRFGTRLYELARGIDNSPVMSDRPTQSISAEDTFEQDVGLSETAPMIRSLAEKVWEASRRESRVARTIVLKLKTSSFKVITRSHTPDRPPASCEELVEIALGLRERVELDAHQKFRLAGVGLSNFRSGDENALQAELFL
jgi:DNA polymerase-4